MSLRLRTAVLLHTYALLLLFTPPPAAAFTCSPQNDVVTCSALADFYTSLNGAGWKSNLGWSLAAPVRVYATRAKPAVATECSWFFDNVAWLLLFHFTRRIRHANGLLRISWAWLPERRGIGVDFHDDQ